MAEKLEKRRFTPVSRQDWRAWLADNHDTQHELWLVFFKKHAPRHNLSYNDAVEEALCFGWIDGIKRSIDEERYEHRFTPRKPNSKWSVSNKKRVARLATAGLIEPAGQREIDLAKESGAWDKPVSSQTTTTVPDELAKRLRRDKQASNFFDSLAPSYRREYASWVASAKRADTRERRVDETMALLKQGKKLGMR